MIQPSIYNEGNFLVYGKADINYKVTMPAKTGQPSSTSTPALIRLLCTLITMAHTLMS